MDRRHAAFLVAGCVAVVAIVIAALTYPWGFLGEPLRPEWARCVPNGPMACTTVDGVALGPLEATSAGVVGACTTPCDDPLALAAAELAADRHAAPVRIDLYGPDLYHLCSVQLCKTTTYIGIFVGTWPDAPPHAVIVFCDLTTCERSDRYGLR